MLKLLDGRHHIVNHRQHLRCFRHYHHNLHHHHHLQRHHHHQHHNLRVRMTCYRSLSLYYSSRSTIALTTSFKMLNRDHQSQILQPYHFSTKTNNLALDSSSYQQQQQQQQQYAMKNMIPKKIVSRLTIHIFIYLCIYSYTYSNYLCVILFQ